MLTGIHQFFYGLVVFILIDAFKIYIWAHLAIRKRLSFIGSEEIAITELMSLCSEMILILLMWNWTYLVQQRLAAIEAGLIVFEKEAALVILLQRAWHMAFARLEHFQMAFLVILLYQIDFVLLVQDFVKVGKAWFQIIQLHARWAVQQLEAWAWLQLVLLIHLDDRYLRFLLAVKLRLRRLTQTGVSLILLAYYCRTESRRLSQTSRPPRRALGLKRTCNGLLFRAQVNLFILSFVYGLLLIHGLTIQTSFLTKNRGVWFSPFHIGHV